jgi:predicted RNase H-like nuclease (RuvC/YqgF family)
MSSSNFEETDAALLSSKELRKISDDMKNALEVIIRSMGDAIRYSMEEKTKATALKSVVIEREEETRNTSEEIASVEKKIINNENIIAVLEKELNNLKTAIEGIKDITSELDPLDAEKAVGSLKGTLIKKQTELEKFRGELNSSRKLKDLATKRLADAEISLQDTKKHYSEKMASADLLAENVEKSISHIVQAYSDVMTVAKELLMENLGSRYLTQSEASLKQQTVTGTTESRSQAKDMGKDREPFAI